MNIKQTVNKFIDKKAKEKKIKIKLSSNMDLFINSIFDSLDFAEFSSILTSEGYILDLKKNDYKIPRSKGEIFKILKLKKNNKNKKNKKNFSNNIDNFFLKIQKNFNIEKRQNILIHSNFTKLIDLDIKPEDFLNKFFQLYPGCTLFSPSGFFREKNKKFISLKKITPSNEFGLLSKRMLTYDKKTKIFRNNNPFDNLVGINLAGKYFKSRNILAYGKNSPYRKLLKFNTSIMLIDVNFFYNSMFHMVELDAKVPYRKNLKFKFGGKQFELFARKKNNLFIDYSRFEKVKKIKKLIKQISFNKVQVKFIDYKSLYKNSLEVLKSNSNFLFKKK